MQANELRRAFTSFFEERGHHVVASASLIPHDATLLFTNAGMVPFKSYFLGEEPAPWSRATTVQKCVRAGGKHNDLDEVGRTSRHLTFFEMLGNFSFGDYFKADAIPMAWQFFTDVLGLDPERLWVTVHLTDDEAADIWADEVGIPIERIQRLDEDNWWRMADTGPNGPCSEIFWDMGPDYGPDGGPANPAAADRFVEIWNLVFMQFDQQPGGEQVPLPKPSIDTGAGLERVLSVLQGVDSVWGTDEFVRLLDAAAAMAGVTERDPKTTVSLQILADHARSTTMLVSDGVFPSNEERGYVLRRIIRRAVRHAYILGVSEPIMGRLVDAVVEILGEAYPDLVANHGFVRQVIEREELSFRRTLESGSAILDTALENAAASGTLDGGVAFTLHDTYGFPLELTQEIATERNVAVDLAAFEDAMAQQRRLAKEDHAAKGGAGADMSAFSATLEANGPTEFVGREAVETTATILLVTEDSIVLDRSPFYAESGGQVGDTGVIATETGRAHVVDTILGAPGQHRHLIGPIEGFIDVGQTATATIDDARRADIRRNHTATHLLHWALRDVLGDHVKQQGSEVGPDRLRFDFSHYEPLTAEQIVAIEDLVNADILENPAVRHFETSMDRAQELGAIAFFGDKYGDVVRVLEAGPHSTELCGGTHVDALGDIGLVKIVSEGSIGSNLRRIEAVTGASTIGLLRAEERTVADAADLLGVPTAGLLDGIKKRLGELEELRTEAAGLRSAAAHGRVGALVDAAVDGIVVARVDGVARDDLKELATALSATDGVDAAVLGAALDGGGVALVASVAGDRHNAAELIADAARTVKGGGGKGDKFAMAGGKDVERLDEALDLARGCRESLTTWHRMRVMGVDLGSRRVGIALSDGTRTIATPHTVLTRSGSRIQDHRAILEIVREWEVARIVVGLPLSLDGHMGKAARAADVEARQLGVVTGVPIETYDERLTTVTAHDILREQGVAGPDRKEIVDKVAAAVLLQAWLDGQHAADEIEQ